MNEEKNTGDKDKIEDKYFKQSIPGLNRLLNILGIPGEIVEILPNEYQNYRDETKTMDLVFDLKSKETFVASVIISMVFEVETVHLSYQKSKASLK